MQKRLAVQVGFLGLLAPITIVFLLMSPVGADPAGGQQGAQASTPAQGQAGGYVGSEACAACHEAAYASYRRSVHYQTEAETPGPRVGCESCHGPGQRHVEAGGDPALIFAFDETQHTAEELASRCLSCHGKYERNFRAHSSEHMKGSVTCSSCHRPHQAATQDALLLEAGYEGCVRCHNEVLAEINLNERHRIKEGIVKCVDCHDPHAPNRRAELFGPFNQRSCVRCHTDKQGPFVFEHPAVRVEGCVSCHRPHGGINRHMLIYQSTARLCYSCHVQVPAFHSRFNETTNCVNCHATIHGSNFDPFFLR